MNGIQPPIDRIKIPTPYEIPWFKATEIDYCTGTGDFSYEATGTGTFMEADRESL